VSVPALAGHALVMAFAMSWEILWALILGFAISAMVQAVVSTREIVRLLGDDRPRTLAVACGLGAASSSCSYAAVAIARSLFRKGAHFTAAMTFQLASTNLVVELSLLMVLLLGWQFAAAEVIGAVVMVTLLAVLFRYFLSDGMVADARAQAERGVVGRMEGHANMHMEVTEGPLVRRVLSSKGRTAISHYFVMDWVSVWLDLVAGLVIAGTLAVVIPTDVWRTFFLSNHPALAKLWGPIVGPLIAIVSFVCSVGNVPLAAVLWANGISFGGAVAFIFADLIILPILDIYRRYYGRRMSLFLLGTFYTAMAGAAYVVELVFGAFRIVPTARMALAPQTAIAWNYTTWLDIAFLVLAIFLVTRFLRTGGPAMLRLMEAAPHTPAGPGHAHSHHMP